jgi:HEPN domain-containing protein
MPDKRQNEIDELVAEWLRRANADLVLAELIDDDRIAPEILAYHAQQSAEKAIKSLLVKRQIEFPFTHVIGVLLDLCQNAGFKLDENLGESTGLTRYAVATRYPGEIDLITREEAREAARLARIVMMWVESQM